MNKYGNIYDACICIHNTVPQTCTRMNALTKCAPIGNAHFVAHISLVVDFTVVVFVAFVVAAVGVCVYVCVAIESLHAHLLTSLDFVHFETVCKSFEFSVFHHEINGIGELNARFTTVISNNCAFCNRFIVVTLLPN